MDTIKFEVISRKENRIATTIRAHAKDSDWDMTLYLDNVTGAVLYPVTIEQAVSYMTITLDGDFTASCGLPPSIPEIMVNGLVTHLTVFHDVVAAARELIKEEQERFKNTRTE